MARVQTLEEQDRLYRVALSDFRRLEGEVREGMKQLNSRLDDGRAERLGDTEKLRDKINELDKALALLLQRIEGRRPFSQNQLYPRLRSVPTLLRIVDYAQ